MTAGADRHLPGVLVEEAAAVFKLLGNVASHHLVIVGGLVPYLLVPDARDQHLGSSDIDFCLSVAITQGQTRQYYRSIEELLLPYFRPFGPSGFRWLKKDDVPGVPLVLDFLGPLAEGETTVSDGTVLLDETAAANAGNELRPFPIRSGELIDLDAITTTIEGVPLFYAPGTRADVVIRHAGPVGFLAAKADALEGRFDSKDGYDVSWWCLNAATTPAEVAELVISRPGFRHELFPESVHQLEQAFKAPDYHGPRGYAAETLPRLGPDDPARDAAANIAYARVSAVIEILKSRLWA